MMRRLWRPGFVVFLAWVLPWFGFWPAKVLRAEVLRAESGISVTFDSPDPFSPAYGEVVIETVVASEDERIERVVFYVDDELVGELTAPPYRLSVSLGDDIGAHRFEVVAHAASGIAGVGHLVTPPLRVQDQVSVDLQQLYVTVSRGTDRVLDLQVDDFEILDARVREQVVTFARGDIPFTAIVLLDASTSMTEDKLRAALQGAKAFFDGMNPLDEGKLLVFSDRILHTTEFTTVPEVLNAGLSEVRALGSGTGGTAISDHLYLAFKQLEQRQGRRVVLLLSDGVDSHSVLSMTDVLAVARRGQALIYWLCLPYGKAAVGQDLPELYTAWRNPKEYRREFNLLKRTVRESGGSLYPLSSVSEIGTAFAGILGELRDQYVLGYFPSLSRHDGRWRPVRVRVRERGLEVRGRGGYFDF